MVSIVSALQSPLQVTNAQIDPFGLEPIPEDTRQRFLKFSLIEGHQALLPLQTIAEIRQISVLDILPIPETSSSMLGVCNWRGDILWLADLNALIGNSPLWHQAPLLEKPMVIVVQSDQKTIGLVVERIDDIELIEPQSIQESTDLCTPALSPYVTGYLANHQDIVLNTVAIIEQLYQGPP